MATESKAQAGGWVDGSTEDSARVPDNAKAAGGAGGVGVGSGRGSGAGVGNAALPGRVLSRASSKERGRSESLRSFGLAAPSAGMSSPMLQNRNARVAQLEASGQRHSAKHSEIVASQLERQLHLLHRLALGIAVAGLALAIIESELRWSNSLEVEPYMDVLKVIISVLTFVLGMCVCIKYKLTMAFLKSRGSLDMHETLVTSGMLLPLLLELLIVLPHPFPFVDTTIRVEDSLLDGTPIAPVYALDLLMTAWMLLRLYLAIPVFHDAMGFHSNSARVISHWNAVSFSPAFTFKTMMDRHPLRLLTVIVLSTITVLGYLMRVFEAPVCLDAPAEVEALGVCDAHRTHSYLLNSFWFVMVTASTVGYGDNYPITSGGRVVSILACFMGVVIIAMFVTGITAMSSFTPDERRAFLALYRTSGKLEQQDMAARVVQGVWRYYKAWSAPLRTGARVTVESKATYKPSGVVPLNSSALSRGGGGGGVAASPAANVTYTTAVPKGVVLEDVRQYKALLSTLRRWRAVKREQEDLHREKSEVALIQKEVLNTSMVLSDFIDAQDGHNAILARVLPAMLTQIDRISAKLGLPESLEPLLHSDHSSSAGANAARSQWNQVPDARRRSLMPAASIRKSGSGRSLRTSSRDSRMFDRTPQLPGRALNRLVSMDSPVTGSRRVAHEAPMRLPALMSLPPGEVDGDDGSEDHAAAAGSSDSNQ